MPVPLFSVIIPTYNRIDLARRAVESVLAQTFTDYELILVDDGSTDGTPSLADEFGGKLACLRQDNRGVSAARNRGIRLAGGDWCVFLDSDDWWLPEKLMEHKRYIEANPGILIHQTQESWIRNGRRVNPAKKHAMRDGNIYCDSLELCLISPSASAVSRKLFERYGMFDEDLPACEDYDLWLRVSAQENVGLIRKQLNVRNAGHGDQLSQKYPGMDRFRIYSMIKMLKSGKIDDAVKVEKTRETALRKSRILMAGANKRGNGDYASRVGQIIADLESERYNSIDSRFLVQEDIHL